MQVTVSKTLISTDQERVNRGEYKATPLDFEFTDEWANLEKVAVFKQDGVSYEVTIENDTCFIPYDVLEKVAPFKLGVYGYENENGQLKLRYSPTPARIYVAAGSFDQDGTTPSANPKERYLLPKNIKGSEGIEIEYAKDSNDVTIINLGGGGGGTSTVAWKPEVSPEGEITWTRSASTTPPDPQNIKGPQGDKGEDGEQGKDGVGVPTGGTTGQILVKKSNEDYDTEWQDNGGGGGGGSLTSDMTVSNPIGKWAKDEVIKSGTSLETIIRGMLSQTYYPTFTAPSASLTYSGATLLKVGAQVTAKAATLAFNAGAIMLEGVKQNNRAGAATGYTLTLSGASTQWSDNNTTGSFSVPAFTRATKGNVTLSGSVAYEAGPQPKDSDGANYGSPLPAGSVSASKTFEFILPFYWGASNTPTIADFTGLTEDLSKKGQKSYTYATANQRMVIAYDAAYGDLTSILDPNSFETINGWNKSVLTVDGQSYNVYITQNPTSDQSARYTFKF